MKWTCSDVTEPDSSPRESDRIPIVGVSRRFGTGHMLVALELFAPLFGFLHAIETPPVAYALCAFFCVAIPLGQVFLYQGREPRRASRLVGTRLLPLLVVGGWRIRRCRGPRSDRGAPFERLL